MPFGLKKMQRTSYLNYGKVLGSNVREKGLSRKKAKKKIR